MKNLVSLSLVSVLAVACAQPEAGGSLPFGDADVAALGKNDLPSLPTTRIYPAIGQDRQVQGGQAIITSAESWVEYAGSPAPADVDFSREWVAFYGLGVRNTGGYSAEILSVTNIASAELLVLETKSQSPGPDCIVTQAITYPFAAIKFEIPEVVPTWATSEHSAETYSCSLPEPDECTANDDCADGEVCMPGYCPFWCHVDDPDCCEPARCEQELHGECGDGSLAICEIVVAPCPDGLVREVENGCFGECVDPVSCLPPPTEVCGDVVCAPGTECCNPLDGICVEPGMACTF